MDMYDKLEVQRRFLREQPIMLNISTAGKGASSVPVCAVYKYAKICFGNDDDDSVFVGNLGAKLKIMIGKIVKFWEMVNPKYCVFPLHGNDVKYRKKAKQSAHSKAEFFPNT